MIQILAALLGALVGLALGLVGGGGSILTVPALIYGLGLDPHDAVTASLALVGAIAAVGAIGHMRHGTVRFGVALRFGLPGIVGTQIGSRLSRLVSDRLLLSLFAFVMIAAAVSLARRDSAKSKGGVDPAVPPGGPGPAAPHPVGGDWLKLALAGGFVGVMTGFFGVGGGFVIVPVLGLVVGLPTRQAVATSLVVIVINCVAALFGHLGQGGTFPLLLLALFAAAGFAGSSLGARLAGRWSERTLSRVFAALVAGVALYLLFRNRFGMG